MGGEGNNVLIAEGNGNFLTVCPASALPAASDLVFFRRADLAMTC